MVRLLWVYYGPGRRRPRRPEGGVVREAGRRPPRLRPGVAARLRRRRPGLLRGQQPAGGDGCWCWPRPADRPWAGSARGSACGPGCRPCCWAWPRWSPWSPRPAWGWSPAWPCPMAAVYLACRGAIRADRERARAEAAAEQARAAAAEQARLVAAEQALIRQLQESDRLKRDLLATVYRELKTPLTVILGTLGTLSRRGAALEPAERREFVDMAVRQGTRLKELIEQLLLAARFELTGQEPAARPLVAAARLAHPERELVLHAREALPVRAAPEAVLQVLGNLLDNAAKYSPDWSPVRLEVTRYGPQAVLAVEDTGPGGRAPTASASSSASPSSTRGPPGRPAGSASASTSPASWPTPRAASCSWPTHPAQPRRPLRAAPPPGRAEPRPEPRPSERGVQTVDWSRCGHLVPPFCAFWAASAISREVEHDRDYPVRPPRPPRHRPCRALGRQRQAGGPLLPHRVRLHPGRLRRARDRPARPRLLGRRAGLDPAGPDQLPAARHRDRRARRPPRRRGPRRRPGRARRHQRVCRRHRARRHRRPRAQRRQG